MVKYLHKTSINIGLNYWESLRTFLSSSVAGSSELRRLETSVQILVGEFDSPEGPSI